MSRLAFIMEEYSEEKLLPTNRMKEILNGVEISQEELKDDLSFYTPGYVDFDDVDVRHDKSTVTPIYLNDFDFNVESDRERAVEVLRTEYPDNNFDTVASCSCKKYRSNIYVGRNFVCDVCGTHVTKPLFGRVETKVWLRTPPGVSGFISLTMYETFFTCLNTKTPKVNIVDYWINDDLREEKRFLNPDTNYYKVAMKLEAFKDSIAIEFGYNNFVNNLDLIVSTILKDDKFKLLSCNSKERNEYIEFWERYKHKSIIHYIPVPNKIISIVETDNRSKYYTREQIELNKIYQTLADIYKEGDPNVYLNEYYVGKLYALLNKASDDVQRNLLFGKKGSIRYHAGAGKLPFTGRSIITGKSGVCRSDVIYVPRLYALTCLDKHLYWWLYRKGYTPLKAKALIRRAAYNECEVINEFLNWIEENSLAVAVAGRNPSIQYLSARAFVVHFNRDLEDKSIRIPITTVKEYNADFDGDQMYIYFLPDLVSKIESYSAWGHHQTLDPNKLYKTSGFVSQTKSNLINFNSIMQDTPIEDE